MLRNYFIIAIRNFLRQKSYTLINILGLAIGISCCILIYLYIQHERSFDKFHAKTSHIYRMHEVDYVNTRPLQTQHAFFSFEEEVSAKLSPYLPQPLGPALIDEIPEVQRFTRFSEDEVIVKYEDHIFREPNFFVDSTFFQIFGFNLLEGDPAHVLNDPTDIVISQSLAKKYFGSVEAVGKQVEVQLYDTTQNFMISGVFEDIPDQSSLDFDLLLPIQYKPYYQHHLTNWRSYNTPVFFELNPEVDKALFEEKLEAFTQKHIGPAIERARTRHGLDEDAKVYNLGYMPLTEIHFASNIGWHKVSDMVYTYILGGIALLILLIACINYISLALARAAKRTTEVGIRKVLGAQGHQLQIQFLGEAILLTLLAMVLSIGLVDLALPTFSNFTGKELSLSGQQFFNVAGILLIISFIVGMIAGGYPAFFLSRFEAVKVIKDRRAYSVNSTFSRALVVLQFACTVFLLFSALIMYQQMSYVNNKHLGYDQAQVLMIPTHTGWSEEGADLVERLKADLGQVPEIMNISGTNSAFTDGWSRIGIETEGKEIVAYTYRIEPDYIPTLGIELIKGNNFAQTSNQKGIIINEQFAAKMGWEDPIGKLVDWPEKENAHQVIGVVKDFHFLPLQYPLEPMMMHNNTEMDKIFTALIKISPNRIPETITAIEQSWRRVAGTQPFEYKFLDEEVAQQYELYQRWTRIMGFATLLSVIIACMGLFGLAGLIAVNKSKEIGIRKVLGADISDILILLNKDLFKLAGFAFLIAAPISYFLMNRWLKDFTYHIDIGAELLLGALCLSLLITVLTVSYQTMKTAMANPVDSLRDE